ncbi:transposase, partial [Streptomyces sp. ISL-100]|nr:transposase [Streptomyces sp. ISL-100]
MDWSRAVIDSSHVRAARRGPQADRTRSTAHGRGSKHHVLVDGQGIPLAVSLTGGNRNDIT